jgi:biotin transport system permease protein
MSLVGIYSPGNSVIHRVGPGPKLLALAVIAVVTSVFTHWTVPAAVAGLGLAAAAAARISPRLLWAQTRGILVLVVLFAAFNAVLGRVAEGALAGGRIMAIVIIATVVTLTTQVSAIVDAVERWLTRGGMSAERSLRVGLMIGMASRAADHLGQLLNDARDARRARGLDRHIRALLVPVVVRAWRTSSLTGEALAARGVGSVRKTKRRER